MKTSICVASFLMALTIPFSRANAQTVPSLITEEGNDTPRGNVHIGMPIAIPLNPTAQAVHLGFGLNFGGGYNITRRHAAVSEFLWNDLFPTNEALAKLRVGLNDPTLNASVHLVALTANYRYELRGLRVGTYFLGGGGLYYRHTNITKEVVNGNQIKCTRSWEWWGFECTSGVVTQSQTLTSWSASAGGFNGGIGFTARVGEPPYRFYVESRYHYVPNSRINTQLINITFGFRY